MSFDESFAEDIKQFISNLNKQLRDLLAEVFICQNLCRKCERTCSLEKNHTQNCDYQR